MLHIKDALSDVQLITNIKNNRASGTWGTKEANFESIIKFYLKSSQHTVECTAAELRLHMATE